MVYVADGNRLDESWRVFAEELPYLIFTDTMSRCSRPFLSIKHRMSFETISSQSCKFVHGSVFGEQCPVSMVHFPYKGGAYIGNIVCKSLNILI